ncbi:MAG: GAF domain-containing protein [Candidatus Bipolaricaulaceae bacterium]
MSGQAGASRELYQSLLAEVAGLADHPRPVEAAVEVLARVPHYSWVGVYLLRGDQLVLGPWRGPAPTPHVRIPVGRGLCGSAAQTGRTEVVDDVDADARYLACFPSTRSEIVVPIFGGRGLLGEIDVDSDAPAAFGEADQRFLTEVARWLAPSLEEAE